MRLKIILFAFSLILVDGVHAQHFYLYDTDQFNVAPQVAYNKVDGLFTGITGRYQFNEYFSAQGKLGYAFSGKYPRYGVGLQKSFPHGNNEFNISADYFRETVSNDTYVIPRWQNSLTSMLFHLDYYDHYETRGVKIRLGQVWNGTYQVHIFGGAQKYFRLDNTTEKSLLDWGADNIGGKKLFSRNPPAAEGSDYFLGLDYDIDFRPSPLAFVSAWHFKGTYSNSAIMHHATRSDFSYNRLDLQFTRYQRLFPNHKMKASLRLASYEGQTQFQSDSLGTLKPRDQFLLDAGGYGSLRGYHYREFENGNRLAVFSLDYYFSGGLFKTFNLVLFGDAGRVWTAGTSKSFAGFGGAGLKNFQADAGAGVALAEYLRLDWAFPLKKGIATKRGDSKVYFRMTLKL